MSDWLDAFTLAAREQMTLPGNWYGYLFERVDGQGVLVTGKCVTRAISRGPRMGEPCFRTADPETERKVFVSSAAADAASKRLREARR